MITVSRGRVFIGANRCAEAEDGGDNRYGLHGLFSRRSSLVAKVSATESNASTDDHFYLELAHADKRRLG